jgi:hypothetical protein
MLKVTLPGKDGRTKLYLGLSFANLDRLRAQPLDTYVEIDGRELNLSVDVVLFSGRNEAEMSELVIGGIGPNTKVSVHDRLKS